MADSALQRWLWRVLERVSTLIGTRGARVVAALAMRAGARTDRGYAKGLYRVASRRRVPMPDLWTVPEAWWSTAPRVSARRLGLRLHLDLRDNLQRTLYFTGTYEPGLLRLVEDELRAGDTVLDVGAHVGVHALTAARRLHGLGGGRVIAFEPTPDSAAAVRAAAARNGLPVEVKDLVMERGPGDEAALHALLAECGYAPAGSPERHVALFIARASRSAGRIERPRRRVFN